MNIFAYTNPGMNYPEFISVNKTGYGMITFIVRSEQKVNGECGDIAQITLSKEQAKQLAKNLTQETQ